MKNRRAYLFFLLICLPHSTFPVEKGKDDKNNPELAIPHHQTQVASEKNVTVNVYVKSKNTNAPETKILCQPTNTQNSNTSLTTVNENKSTATNVNKNENKIKIYFKNIFEQVMQISPSALSESTCACLKRNKTRLILSSLGISYVGLCVLTIAGNIYLNQNAYWASWKQQL